MGKFEKLSAKILIDCERLKYPHSGLANVCRTLIYGLESLHPAEEITVYGPKNQIPESAFPIAEWSPLHKFFPPAIGKYDLIHVTQQLSEYFHHTKNLRKK